LAEEVAELKVVVAGLQQQLMVKAYPPLQPNQSHYLKLDVHCAVYTELADKDKHVRNVVVLGLAPVDGVSDEELFVSLCETNLNMKPAVQQGKCHRLGRKRPDRIQPLLVTRQSSESVVELAQSAPRLRKSADHVIISSVYINHDMTVAERKLAYERRVKHRHSPVCLLMPHHSSRRQQVLLITRRQLLMTVFFSRVGCSQVLDCSVPSHSQIKTPRIYLLNPTSLAKLHAVALLGTDLRLCVLTILMCVLLLRVGLPRSTLTNLFFFSYACR